MHYTDILLFQGSDPDGIEDTTSRILAVLHGINRAHGNHGDEHRKKGDYPLAIAFPRWRTPTMSANKRLSQGTTGAILRIFSERDELLNHVNQHGLMQDLELQGKAQTDKVRSAPDTIQWVSYQRYHRKQKRMSQSYAKRHLEFLEKKKKSSQTQETLSENKLAESPAPKKEPYKSYLYLKIPRKNNIVILPVTETIHTSKTNKALRINSWGLTTEGGLPYF